MGKRVLTTRIGPGGRLAPIPGAAPLRQEINDPSIPKGAKRVKIRSVGAISESVVHCS